MQSNLELIEKLANSPQKTFMEHNLEAMGIHHPDWEDLVRKGFLTVDKSKSYPEWVFSLSSSAYDLIQNKQIAERGNALTKKSLFWQKLSFTISIGIALLALIVAILAYLKP